MHSSKYNAGLPSTQRHVWRSAGWANASFKAVPWYFRLRTFNMSNVMIEMIFQRPISIRQATNWRSARQPIGVRRPIAFTTSRTTICANGRSAYIGFGECCVDKSERMSAIARITTHCSMYRIRLSFPEDDFENFTYDQTFSQSHSCYTYFPVLGLLLDRQRVTLFGNVRHGQRSHQKLGLHGRTVSNPSKFHQEFLFLRTYFNLRLNSLSSIL